jgi:D-arabinose 5-phosphate isomerase GutQ
MLRWSNSAARPAALAHWRPRPAPSPDDVIMALSWSGETVELKDLIDYSRRFRIGLIAVVYAVP